MDWLRQCYDKTGERISYLRMLGSDVQNTGGVFLTNHPSPSDLRERKTCDVTRNNLATIAVYFAVRHCIEMTWLNDRDQFLWPCDDWKDDLEFQSDCLAYTILSSFNNIQSQHGPNHWIPYTEVEVGAKDCFASHFMSEFMAGKVGDDHRASRNPDPTQLSLNIDCGPLGDRPLPNGPLVFSPAARDVLDAGRALWRYYHAQPNANPNASYYDIRAHFQGRKPNGTMNATSDDAKYNELLDALKAAHKRLAAQIAPKVYAYGFLRA